MKAAELKDLTVEELSRKAGELRENLFNLKIRRRAGTLESVSDVTKNKRDLARILTLLTQKNGSSKAQKKASSRQPPAASPQPPAASPQPPAASQPSAEKKA
jgi:large subunit ribosomal protein L29